MRNITYFKLFNRENLNIDSAFGMHAVVAFMQRTGFIDAFEKSAKVSRIRNGIEPAALLTASICALMDGADRIEQIPCFLEKNRKFVKSIGLPVIPHSTTFYKLLKRINKDGEFAKKMKVAMQEIISKWYLNEQKEIIIDIDATYMKTNKKCASMNYKGEKSISALLMHIGMQQFIWDYEIREGYENPRTGIPEMVSKFVNHKGSKEIKKLYRMDSAGYSSDTINACKDMNNNFIIKMAEHVDMEKLFENVTNWETYNEDNQNGNKRE